MSTSLDKRLFKKVFSNVAANHGFSARAFGWSRLLQKNGVSLVVLLRLVNSRLTNGFDAWTYVYVDQLFGTDLKLDRSILKAPRALFRVEQTEYKDVFDLDSSLGCEARKEQLETYFQSIVHEIVSDAAQSAGFSKIAEKGLAMITPPVESELRRLGAW